MHELHHATTAASALPARNAAPLATLLPQKAKPENKLQAETGR